MPTPLRRALPAAALLLVWLVGVVGTMTVTLATLPPTGLDVAYDWLRPYPEWVQALSRWDANHYLDIARDGYQNPIQPAFYPLYPLLVRGVASLGVGLPYAGVLVSWVAALVALVCLRGIARDRFGDEARVARTAVVFLLAPGAFFLAAIYTEALFCALAFAAFLFAGRGQWARTGLVLALLTATRLPALVVLGAIVVEHLAQKGFSLRPWRIGRLDRSTAWLALAPVGVLSWYGWCWAALDDPLASFHAYDIAWTYQVFDPNIAHTLWVNLVKLAGYATAPGGPDVAWLFRDGLGVGTWLVLLGFTVVLARRQPFSWTVLAVGTLVLTSINSNFQAVNRYALVVFPVAVALAGSRRLAGEGRLALVLLPSAAVLFSSAMLFAQARWVG
ncbi:mannosyltransferase family protein [Kineococcus gynurae]|uniref:Mannosyltransferase family protein n=1 Tax=Kineococcus gynurae TaxID=452979 RepID=A0ABV5LPW6_9ACTN